MVYLRSLFYLIGISSVFSYVVVRCRLPASNPIKCKVRSSVRVSRFLIAALICTIVSPFEVQEVRAETEEYTAGYVEQLEQENAKLQEQLQDALAELEQLRGAMNTQQVSARELETAVAVMRAERTTKNKTISSLQSEVSSLSTKLESTKAQADRVEALESDIKSLKSGMAEASAAYVESQETIKKLEAELATAKSELSTAKADVVMLTADLESTKKTLDGLRTLNAEASTTVGERDTVIAQLNEKITALEDDLSKQKSTAANTKAELTSTKKKYDKLKAEYEKFKSEVDTNDTTELESTIAELEDTNGVLQSNLESVMASYREAQSTITEQEGVIEELQNEIAELKTAEIEVIQIDEDSEVEEVEVDEAVEYAGVSDLNNDCYFSGVSEVDSSGVTEIHVDTWETNTGVLYVKGDYLLAFEDSAVRINCLDVLQSLSVSSEHVLENVVVLRISKRDSSVVKFVFEEIVYTPQ